VLLLSLFLIGGMLGGAIFRTNKVHV
jgi:hypothetical protein